MATSRGSTAWGAMKRRGDRHFPSESAREANLLMGCQYVDLGELVNVERRDVYRSPDDRPQEESGVLTEEGSSYG